MSEQLRHRMTEFEALPPHAAWKAIAERLDDDKQYAPLSVKMNDFNVIPPAGSWESIAARINDDNQYALVAAKMNNFDAAPPAANWEAIISRLDDDKQYAAVATKMQNFDAAPPQKIWNSIAASLTEREEVAIPVINIRRRIYQVAAAAIIISIFIGGWMFMNRNSAHTEFVKNNNAPAPVVPAIKEENTITPHNNITQKVEIVAVQPASRNRTYTDNIAHENNGEGRILKYAVVNSLPSFHETPIVIRSSPILDKEGNIIRDMDVLTTSNYLVVMGPNGQLTRISSKFASVIRYLNSNDDSEEYLDKVIKESDTWKKRFHEWRSKISQSSFIPSSANFLDIVEFKELIQEKQ